MNIRQRRVLPKTNASLISIFQRFSDITIIFLSLFLTCYINEIEFNYSHVLNFLVMLVIFQMIGGITDFYRSWRGIKLTSELTSIIKNWSLSVIFGIALMAYSTNMKMSFHLLFEWYIFVCIGVLICRSLIRYSAQFVRTIGYNTRNVAIAGSLPVGQMLAQSFIDEPWLGFNVYGIYDDNYTMDKNNKYIGDLQCLIRDAKDGKLDRIYIAMSMDENDKIKNLVKSLTNTTCSVMLIPDTLTLNILHSRTEEVNGVPVVPLFDTPLNGINMVIKRGEDIILSLLILILIFPILILISCVIKCTSKGPVLFKQIRYGMDGKPIKVWKFRSMTVMENGTVIKQATKDDIRITPVGKFLRRTSLDELPQFFNVLLGGMSIVGPRPHAVAHNELYRDLIEGYMLRHKVKPGITGWAQINGWRGETDTIEKMEKRIEYDLEYIRDWSIWFDLKIIFLTIFKGFIHKTAY
ncbi:TPA: undecaprenyl-phosphate glucose phosphotransferase [Escherichia coli]|nr:undecaprenyl-phosphate glucose phosphotransferase [Escherichia coli]